MDLAAHACSELIWQKGLLHKGPGLCHGVSGNGYAFLMMYRLTNDDTYLTKAKLFGLIMMNPDFQKQARVPDRPWSLFEGWAGALCFLSDLLNPNNAQFPLIPISFSQ
uniref:LanC-like protein n=1 Tax=Panagrolaimus sp. ES5 TaxID=591445 RepID=A0AC34GCK7_9BILA